MREKITKGFIEFFLILFSVLLAFYLEDARQNINEKKELVRKLQELRASLRKDSTDFEDKQVFLKKTEDSLQSLIIMIVRRKNATSIKNGVSGARFYYSLRNWTLERELEHGSLDKFSSGLREALYEYTSHRNFATEAIESPIYVKDREIEAFVNERLKYDFILTAGRTSKQIIKDSSALYSDALKSYLVKKKDEVNLLRAFVGDLPRRAHNAAIKVDSELLLLK